MCISCSEAHNISSSSNAKTLDTSLKVIENPGTVLSAKNDIVLSPSDDYKLYNLTSYGHNLYRSDNLCFMMEQKGNLYYQNKNDTYIKVINYENSDNDSNLQSLRNYEQDIYARYKSSINKYVGFELSGQNYASYVCETNGSVYFEIFIIEGGGSGEYWGPTSGRYIGINKSSGEVQEFKGLRAGDCVYENDWVYYVDVLNGDGKYAAKYPQIDNVLYVVGYPSRMRPDGSERQRLNENIAYGSFVLQKDKLYYFSCENNALAVTDDGQKQIAINGVVLKKNCEYSYQFGGDFILISGADDSNSYLCTDDYNRIIKLKDVNEIIMSDKDSVLIGSFNVNGNEEQYHNLYLYSNLTFE